MQCPKCDSHRVMKVSARNAKPNFTGGQLASYGAQPQEWQCAEANCQHRWSIEPAPKATAALPVKQEDTMRDEQKWDAMKCPECNTKGKQIGAIDKKDGNAPTLNLVCPNPKCEYKDVWSVKQTERN